MKIARVEYRWRLLGFGHVVHDCLEVLAYQQGYRVCEVSRELGLSEQHLRRMFHRDVGLPLKEWMQWERMVVARRMLVWGMDPLEISDQLGFSHPDSFRREFQMVYLVSPHRFMETRVIETS